MRKKKSSEETEKERNEKQLFNQAARLFTLFAKVGPIGGQVSHGITPQRRVDFFELFAVLATLCRGSMPEKAHLLFAVFDVNGSMDLSEDELALLISCVNGSLSKLRVVGTLSDDDIDYAVSLAFTDRKGRTRHHFTPHDFEHWLKTSDTSLGILGPLSILARLQNVIYTIKARALKVDKLIKFESRADVVLSKLFKSSVKSCGRVTARMVRIGKVGESATIIVEVDGTVESTMVVRKEGLPKSRNVVFTMKTMLVGNVPTVLRLPYNVLEPLSTYKITFSGFGKESPSVIVKTPPRGPDPERGFEVNFTQIVSVVCAADDPENEEEDMFKQMDGSSLVIRLNDSPVKAPEVVLDCLQKLESELDLVDFEDEDDPWAEEILDSLDMKYASLIRSVYRAQVFTHTPTLYFGHSDVWLGVDPLQARRKFPKGVGFLGGILEIVRREYVDSLWGDDSVLAALGSALEGDDQDHLLTLQNPDLDSFGEPSGVVNLGSTRILCLAHPTPDDIIDAHDLMEDDVDEKGRKKPRGDTFDGKVAFTSRQWRKIRSALKQDPDFRGSSSGSTYTSSEEESSQHVNVVFVTTFPLLYNAVPSEVEDSFIDSGGGGLSTIVSGGSEEDNSSVQFSLESLLGNVEDEVKLEPSLDKSEEQAEPKVEADVKLEIEEPLSSPPATSPGRRRNVRRLDEVPSSPTNAAAFSGFGSPVERPVSLDGSDLGSGEKDGDDGSMSSMQSRAAKYPQIKAIPIPVPRGFVLQGFRGDGDSSGFGRDDPPWIGGEDLSGGKQSKENEKQYTKQSPVGRGSQDASPVTSPVTTLPGSALSPLSPDAPSLSPEKDNTSILVDGREIGKVRESVVTGSMLADLLFEEAEEKAKAQTKPEGSMLSDPLNAETDAPSSSPPPAPEPDTVQSIWPDKRASLYFQLAKAQFKCGETKNALEALNMGIEVSSSSDLINSWPYKTLLSNLTNTLQRGSDSLEFQVDAPVDDVIDSFFPEEEGDDDDSDQEEREPPTFFELLTSKTALMGGFKAFPLPSHIRARSRWRQLKIAGMSYAFETGLERLYESPDDVTLIQGMGTLAFGLGNSLGVRTAKLYRFASVLLQKAFIEQKFEQPNTDKREMLHKLARSHYLAWQSQGILADKEHLDLSAAAFDLIMSLPKDSAALPVHYLHYSETLTAMGKKTQAVQSLMQLIKLFPDDSNRPTAELRLATLLNRLYQFEDAAKHFNLADRFLETRPDGKIASGLVSSAVVKMLAGMNMRVWGVTGDPSQGIERASESLELSLAGFSKIFSGSSSASLTGIVGRKFDYSRGKVQKDQLERYLKDPRSIIALAQLLAFSGDFVIASQVFELATSLDLGKLAGVQMLRSDLENLLSSTLEKAVSKVEEKADKEALLLEEKRETLKKTVKRKGFMLNDDDLALFLAMISKFIREGGGKRRVSIICKDDSRTHTGMVTDIVDTRKVDNKMSFGDDYDESEEFVEFQQICIGKCGKFKLWDDDGETAEGIGRMLQKHSGTCGADSRFKFKHSLKPNRQSFAQVKEVVGEESERFQGPDGHAVGADKKSSFVSTLVTGVEIQEAPVLILGPIIGKTTSTSSILLLEVDSPGCEVAMKLNCMLTGHTVSLGPKFVPGKKPFTFLATGLTPNSRYTVRIVGPRISASADGVSASFSTMPTNPCAVTFAVVNSNKVTSKEANSNSDEAASLVPNLWDVMLKDLADREFSPTAPDFILHLGAQVDVRTAYDESRLLLERWRKANPSVRKPPSDVILSVKELFRDAYRVSWGRVPNVRKVLSCAPSIMITGISDVVGTIVRQSQLEFDPEIAAVALQVAREYQAKLWDLDAEERADDELEDIDLLSSVKKDNFVSPLGHFHRFGRVGLLCIDALTSNLFATARNVALPLITAGQLQWLTRVIGESEDEENAHRDAAFQHETELAAEEMKERRLKYDDSDLRTFTDVDEKYKEKLLPRMHSLVICCEQPIVWHRHEDAKKFVSDPRRVGNGSAKVIKNSFSYHIEDCGRLLVLLFAWKQKYPGRDVLILCSSAGTGVFNTEITDTTTNLKIRQWAVPGVTCASLFPFDAQLTGAVGKRFVYKHTPVVPEPHNAGLYDRMKEMRTAHRLEMATLEIEHEVAMRKRAERQEAIARGETFEDEDDGGAGNRGAWDDDEDDVERPKTPQEKKKEREAEEERIREVQREKELAIAAQALVGGGDMFRAMEMISSSRPNTAGTGSRPGTGARKFGSRPGTSASRAKTPQEKKRDEMWGPGLTEERIWEVIRETEEYKRRRDMGYLRVTSVTDTEQPDFCRRFVTPLVPDAEVTVGPVIGEVTTTSAKILLEINSHVKVRCMVQKLHDTSFFDYEELGDLASYQLQAEMCKMKISMQDDFEDDSDPIVIDECAKQIERLEHKIKGLAEKLERVKTEVQTIVCEANDPVIFHFDDVLEPNTKYWVKFEPFSELSASFMTLPSRPSVLTLSLVHGTGHFGGLLHASTPLAYESWRNILSEADGGGGSKFNRFRMATRAATSYHKFGQSYNPMLEDDEIIPVFSDNPNLDYDVEAGGAVTPRMTRGWYGGASGVGRGGERGLAPGGNAMILLDREMSEPRRSHNIMIQTGGCGIGELVGKLNASTFFDCLKVAVGLKEEKKAKRSKLIGGDRRGGQSMVRKTLRDMTPKRSSIGSSRQSLDATEEKGDEGDEEGSGFGDFLEMRVKTIKDDAYLGFSDEEDGDGGVIVTESALKLMDRDDGVIKKRIKGEDYVYQKPSGGEHIEGSGGTLGNTVKTDDSSCGVPVPDAAVWPPEEQKDKGNDIYSDEVGEDGLTEAQHKAERECMDMLKNAYRALYTLPLADNVYKNVARISLFTPDDMQKGLEHGLKLAGVETKIGDSVVSPDLHPLAAKRLRTLSVKAWEMYSGSLRIEPIRERAANKAEDENSREMSFRESMKLQKKMEEEAKKPVHQARFLNVGNTSILTVDVRSRRCITEHGLWGPPVSGREDNSLAEVELLSSEQWRFLKRTFNSADMKRSTALTVVMEGMLVSEDIFTGVGVDHKRRASVTFEDVEKSAEKDGKQMSKKAVEAERLRQLKIQRCSMPVSTFYTNEDVTVHWPFHAEEQMAMLDLLFEWLEGSGTKSKDWGVGGDRSLVVVCGGVRGGVETVVTDSSTGRSFKQVCVGTMGDFCRPFDLERKGVVVGSGGKYSFEHFPVADGVTDDGISGRHSAVKDRRRLVRGWSYGEVEILSEPYDSVVNTRIMCRYGGRGDSGRESVTGRQLKRHPDHVDERLEEALRHTKENGSSNYIARKLLGPVLGKIDVLGNAERKINAKTGGEPEGVYGNSAVARVMLELDSPALVTLVATNVLTSEQSVSVKRCAGRMPTVFVLEGLQQGRRYYCEWYGFEKGDCDASSFYIHTPLDDSSDFLTLVVSGDKPDEGLGKDEETMWGLLADRLEDPWHGTDVLLHVGGQSGSKKDDAFMECLSFVKKVEARKERAALEHLAAEKMKLGGKNRKLLEDPKEEEALVEVEREAIEAAKRSAVSEEEDEAVDFEVRERFRTELRADWNQPSKARVLCSVSNVMMRGGSDVCSNFSRHVGGCMDTVAGRRVARLAEEVNREYMRQLWDSSNEWADEAPYQGFFTTWRGGMAGCLFIDTRQGLPRDAEVSMGGELENPLKSMDHPLIGDDQWALVKAVLARDSLVNLMVVCEVPFVWESKEEARRMGMSDSIEGEGNYIQDHWAYRTRQLTHVLQALFDWRAEKKGRALQLVCGNGSGNNCGFITRITQKVVKERKKKGGEEKEKETAEEDRRKQEEEENDPPIKDIMQICVPPVTGIAEKFKVKRSGLLGPFSYSHSPLEEGIRGYGLIEGTIETGDSGNPSDMIASIDARIVSLANADANYPTEEDIYETRSPEDLDGTLREGGAIYKLEDKPGHPKGLYNNVPRWWYNWSKGFPSLMFEDEVYFRARESEEHIEARSYIEKDGVFNATIERAFVEFHLDDAARPVNLRTMNVGKTDVLLRQLNKAVCAVWDKGFEDTPYRYTVSNLKDDFVFHWLMRKCAAQAGDGLKTLQGFVKFVKRMFIEAGVMRMAVLCQQHQEWLDRTRLEREGAARRAEIEKIRKEKTDFEAWQRAEEARLQKLKVDNKLDEYQLKTVEKKQKEKEWAKKEEENNARIAELEQEEKDKIKSEEERVAEELKLKAEQEAEEAKKEQDEMNRLAEDDEEEYDRRLEAMRLKQAEQLEKEKEGQQVRRRRLVQERKVERRNSRMLVVLPTRRPKREVVLPD